MALLRGIAPSNPNMRNERLRAIVEELGFDNVATVISSGNVVFTSSRKDVKTMEAEMEKAWRDRLGFQSATIIRSRSQMERLAAADPYAGLEHSPSTYLLVTFCKRAPRLPWKLPYQPEGRPYQVLASVDGVLCSLLDTTTAQTPDLMTWLDQTFGKEISSRTWLTVHRILNRMRTHPA